LLAAEITAVCKKDPGELYLELTYGLGKSYYRRSEAPATNEQKAALEHIAADDIHATDLAGEKPITITTEAAGDGNSIVGIKVAAANGWFAARPSGTEAIYKIYAESFSGVKHLALIEANAQTIANQALATAGPGSMNPELQETK
jgi:phosphoglucomutase